MEAAPCSIGASSDPPQRLHFYFRRNLVVRKYRHLWKRGLEQLLDEVAYGGIGQDDGRGIRTFQLAGKTADKFARRLRCKTQYAVMFTMLHSRLHGLFGRWLHQVRGYFALRIGVRF